MADGKTEERSLGRERERARRKGAGREMRNGRGNTARSIIEGRKRWRDGERHGERSRER